MNVLYDFSCYLKSEFADNFDKETDKIKSLIKKTNGVIIEESVPSKKILNYPILKYKEGLFFFMKFLTEAKNIPLLKISLNKEDGILRFLLVKDYYKETAPKILKPKTAAYQKKERIEPSVTEEQIEEIDKKLEEILGSKN